MYTNAELADILDRTIENLKLPRLERESEFACVVVERFSGTNGHYSYRAAEAVIKKIETSIDYESTFNTYYGSLQNTDDISGEEVHAARIVHMTELSRKIRNGEA